MEPKALVVELSTKTYHEEEFPQQYLEDYLGGRGLGMRLLHDYVKPGVDPFSPENCVMFVVGPLHATKAFYSSKACLVTKSPQTNLTLYTIASGTLCNNLHKCGYSALVITGKAEKPSYIVVRDNKVEFKDATRIWGMTTADADYFISSAVRDPDASIAVIGPAGENLVKFACVVTEGRQRQAFGRGGAGAVMGSKNLKAVVVKGSHDVRPANAEAFKEAQKFVLGRLAANPAYKERQQLYGTRYALPSLNMAGILPTKNWFTGQYQGIEAYEPERIREEYIVENVNCAPACPNPCYHWLKVTEGEYAGAISCGPEYETIYVFGPSFGNPRMDSIIAADDLCDLLGLDTISAGQTLDWAAECFEKGILTLEDTDGIDVRFGNHSAMLPVLRKMAYREGNLGELLAEGSFRAAQKLGHGSIDWAMTSKGLEFGGYECRGSWGQAIQFALSHRGGCHHDLGLPARIEMGTPEAVQVEGQGLRVKKAAFARIVFDSSIMCTFPLGVLQVESAARLLSAATGRNLDVAACEEIAERILHTERLYNARNGFGREQDRLPARLLKEPLPDGPHKGLVVPLEDLKDEFYTAAGWDLQTAAPTPETLAKFNINIPEQVPA